MDRNEFNSLLKQANLTKKEFSQIIGMQYSSVNNWGSSQDFPRWVKSWLQNYIKS
ncbi:XRE family transcriptional regulator, partial [Campylobacter lari]|nr:XRE family transcriptional regulator [Campylobacter lari]